MNATMFIRLVMRCKRAGINPPYITKERLEERLMKHLNDIPKYGRRNKSFLGRLISKWRTNND